MSSNYVLVAIDEYRRFTIVKISTHLNSIFVKEGFLTVVKTDNWPPFQSQEFKDFSIQLTFFIGKPHCSSLK